MNFLSLNQHWLDMELQPFEFVERKGLGHPDSLADTLADLVSIEYSKQCLERFGVVLHHNLDKIYIGGGHFNRDFGSSTMLAPVRVSVNGRISNTMNGEKIDVRSLQTAVVKSYLRDVMPRFDVEQHLVVDPNATQHTLRDHWFTPRSKVDLPEFKKLTANDTSLCVAFAPFTTCEALCLVLEQALWVRRDDGIRVPRWNDIGQDIKVMVQRENRKISITLCIPFISCEMSSLEHYFNRRDEVRDFLRELTLSIVGSQFDFDIAVNTGDNPYLLGIGSCIECGEEGFVGRGNAPSGVISSCRPFTMEAAYGKNPVYHTGRVWGYLTQRLAWALYRETGMPNIVHALTLIGGSLIPPKKLVISTPGELPRDLAESIIDSELFSVDYLTEILKAPATLRALDIAEDNIRR